MIEPFSLRFLLRFPGGHTQELIVDSESARIGSGAHCEIRLAPEDAAVEHLHVHARSGVVFGEARCLEPSVLLHGCPFVKGRILPDSVLNVGSVEVSIRAVDRDLAAGRLPGPSRAGRRIVLALAGLGIPLGIAMLAVRPDPRPVGWDVESQSLWPTEERFTCPQTERPSAEALAERQRVQAEAARERAPFSPQDGVQAVELFGRAASCYSVAGAMDEASDVEVEMATLRHQLEQQFHVHQVRLERALVMQQYEQARTEIRILLSFASHRADTYVNWLATLDRQIVVQFLGKPE